MPPQPVEILVLGPVLVRRGTLVATPSSALMRAVIGALALAGADGLSVDLLAEAAWPAKAKPTEATVAVGVHRARHWLAEHFGPSDRIQRTTAGYRLRDVVVDADRFAELASGTAGLADALHLWRGEPLTGTPVGAAVVPAIERLGRLRLDIAIRYGRAQVRTGRAAGVVELLRELAAVHPLDEALHAVLVEALASVGRQAEALARYERLRTRLADELAVDPGPELSETLVRVLRQETAGTRPQRSAPRQLPAAPRWFVARTSELAALTKELEAPTDSGPPTKVVAVNGTGGVGKTWLVLRWAWDHLDRFPDGQLFVDLRGFAPSGEPVPADVAIRGFLTALGVDPKAIPRGLDAQVGLYRSLTADRDVLVVLDNARDTEQIAPLLPSGPRCAAIVTSRTVLTGLVTAHGATSLSLDVLPASSARALLAERLGAESLADEPDAVTELLACCGGFPLALSIVAGRMLTNPRLSVAALADELRQARTGLAALDDDDPASSLPAVLSWSHRALTDDQAMVFALLGVAPGPDISDAAARSLTGLDPVSARSTLRALERASLIQQHVPGRWRMHDLVRLYAAEQGPPSTDTALRRVVDFYAHTAEAANRLLDPYEACVTMGQPVPGCHPQRLDDHPAAMAWLDAEYANVLAAARTAEDHDWPDAVWPLSWGVQKYQYRTGRLADRMVTALAGQAAADRLADPDARTKAHRVLGHCYGMAGQYADAVRHLELAIDVAGRSGDVFEQASAHYVLGSVHESQGHSAQALEQATESLRLFESIDNPVWQGRALNAVGWTQSRLGRQEEARAACEQCLVLCGGHGDHAGESAALDSLGSMCLAAGDPERATEYYERALSLRRALGNMLETADVLSNLGTCHQQAGRPDAARAAWSEAAALLRTQHRLTDAERVGQLLAALPS
jgi:DNA-binding SARP family transcriptional activator/Tfp pilus assembly protein PilF